MNDNDKILINDENDDLIDYDKLNELLLNDISYKKESFIKNLDNNGKYFIQEKNINETKREKKRQEYIDYINNNTKNKLRNELSLIDIEMLEDKNLFILYDQIKYENRSFFKKIFEFLFLKQ